MTDIWAGDDRRRARRFWTWIAVTVAVEVGAVIGVTATYWTGCL